ncbi:MAG TPA: response regulator [Candidatus Aminicenantes bacterium]|nr:response regulator [Candidatus Aminicenantes bacterium]
MAAKKIVIVDDEESIRKTFFLILNKSYRVYLAKDGAEAQSRFKSTSIDLMIADYRLPDMNGIELVESLRRNGYGGEVILISAYADLIEPEVLARLRISHFFAKPLDLNALNRSIDYLLRKDEYASGRPL